MNTVASSVVQQWETNWIVQGNFMGPCGNFKTTISTCMKADLYREYVMWNKIQAPWYSRFHQFHVLIAFHIHIDYHISKCYRHASETDNSQYD